MVQEQLTRRSFVAGAALASATLAGSATALATEANASAATEVAWDKEADVVVVGTGTVAVAAIAASRLGAGSVIVLEKLGIFGGTTAMSGQGVGIPCNHVWQEDGCAATPEEVLEYYRVSSNSRVDLDVAQSYIDHGDEYLRWTEDEFGFTWGYVEMMGNAYSDYYDPISGYGAHHRPVAVQSINGETDIKCWTFYEQAINEDPNIELLMESPATRLVTDASGAVVGVIATQGDTELAIKANKAVILGTGGYEHNASMRAQHLPFPLVCSQTCTGNTGDGQRMAQSVGADLAYMDRCWGLPHVYLGEKDPALMAQDNELQPVGSSSDPGSFRGLPGMVLVNYRGERVANECASYDTFNRVFGTFDTDTSSFSNIPLYAVIDQKYVAPWGLPGAAEDGTPSEEYWVKEDTLEEVAEKLGIDVDGFVKEMEQFNADAERGIDPKFHRGEHDFDLNTTGAYLNFTGVDSGTPNPLLSPLVNPPFYGIKYVPGTFGTCGGAKINKNAQVVNVNGEPIRGLYAVGNCSSGVAGGNYAHGGITVGQGSVMGFVAAKHIAGQL